MPEWDPQTYLQFANERTRPSVDLTQRVGVVDPASIIDLGCGPGNSTEVVRRRWPKAKVDRTGQLPAYDRGGPKSLARGTWSGYWRRGHVDRQRTLRPGFFQRHAAVAARPCPAFASACFEQVAAGGAIAIQMPAHYELPMHREIVEVSRDPAWDDRMQPRPERPDQGACVVLLRHAPADGFAP